MLHRKRLYKKLRETKKELEQATKEMYDQLMQINDIYIDRLAYLIDTKCRDTDGLLQEDVDKWVASQEEEYSIVGTWDEKTDGRLWSVVREAKEDEQLLGEETKE